MPIEAPAPSSEWMGFFIPFNASLISRESLQGNPILIVIVLEKKREKFIFAFRFSINDHEWRFHGRISSDLKQLPAHVTCGPILSNRCS